MHAGRVFGQYPEETGFIPTPRQSFLSQPKERKKKSRHRHFEAPKRELENGKTKAWFMQNLKQVIVKQTSIL